MVRTLLRACLAVSLLALPFAARAEQTYRWLDEQGRLHFGSEPPPDARDVRKADGAAIHVVPAQGGARAPSAASASGRTPVQTLPPATEESEPAVIGGRTQDQWRRDAQTLERRVESLEADLERAEDALSSAYSMSDQAYLERKVASLKSQIESAEGAVDALEERARKLEVPPGWLR